MNKVIYLTLADAYKSNVEAHDSALKNAVKEASMFVGIDITIKALINTTSGNVQKLAA